MSLGTGEMLMLGALILTVGVTGVVIAMSFFAKPRKPGEDD